MKFHIPFTIGKLERIQNKPILFRFLIKHKKKSKLQFYLDNTDTGITREQYLNIAFKSFSIFFVFFFIILTTVLGVLNINLFYVISFIVSLIFGAFVLFSQLIYPKIWSTRKDKSMERNLIPALEDILVQLNSGVPLFSILVNISASEYGELSKQFKKAVQKINAGFPQAEVLEELGEKSSSIFFQRTLWQISNGMKAGSDLSAVISDSIKSLNAEQHIQIQNYGNKLNPLIMFYMLISVIMPALAITFLTIISSLVGLGENATTLLYIGLFVFVVLMQVMFLGVIKSARPTLL